MKWLREYMATDAAKNAKSPFPGMVKEASVYVKPAAIAVTKGDVVPVTVRARLKTKTIERIELYVNDELLSTMTEAPYNAEFTPMQSSPLRRQVNTISRLLSMLPTALHSSVCQVLQPITHALHIRSWWLRFLVLSRQRTSILEQKA